MSTIVIDGLNEEDFRRSIENRLREGMPGVAIARLRAQIVPYAGPGGLLPERFLSIEAKDLTIGGWDGLRDAVSRHDLPGRLVTALSVAFGYPGEAAPWPDAQGRLKPLIEVSYYGDDAWPFSLSARDDLLEGYSFYGCTWAGDSIATDNALWLEGVDDLHGALALLEAGLLANDEPDEHGVRAGSLGACLLSALLVQAVSDRIAEEGLPRPLCVMAGSSGVYPYFDAPVAGMPEAARRAAEADEEAGGALAYGASLDVPAPRYSSLMMTSIPRARKRPALVLEETEEDLANRLAKLRGLGHGEGTQDSAPDAPVTPEAETDFPDFSPVVAEGSPLLAKKPHGQPWDFRDMLGPREPEAAARQEAEAEVPEWTQPAAQPSPMPMPLEDVPVSEWPAPEPEQAEPEQAEVAQTEAPAEPARPFAEPGFDLIGPDLQRRLQELLEARDLPIRTVEWPEPGAALAQAETGEPEQAEWREDQAAAPAPEARPPSTGLGARLGAWWAGLRGKLGR